LCSLEQWPLTACTCLSHQTEIPFGLVLCSYTVV